MARGLMFLIFIFLTGKKPGGSKIGTQGVKIVRKCTLLWRV